MATSLALLKRGPDEHIAQLVDGRRISAAEFLAQVGALASTLPSGNYAINLCKNRYQFMLGFCALIASGKTNLLPASRADARLVELREEYPQTFVLHDGDEVDAALFPATLQFDTRSISIGEAANAVISDRASSFQVPMINADHLAAVVFTSGSTAKSKPIEKPWHTFVHSSEINCRHMLEELPACINMLATVPGQHMYGLETSVLLPLFFNICVADAQPLFPKDVQSALQALDAPRALVSSPAHFRALVQSGLDFPSVRRVLSATAPLDAVLAKAVQQQFSSAEQKATVCEIFGCSEVGSLAWRNPCESNDWALFDGMKMTALDADVQSASGGVVEVSAPHLPTPVNLEDIVSMKAGQQFRLLGRQSDMVNVAGKRGSLAQLNAVLLGIAGVVDGCVFTADTGKSSADRIRTRGDTLAALVVSNTVTSDVLRQEFRRHVDAALIPRPMYFVDSLPRSESGKLPLMAVREVYQQLKTSLKNGDSKSTGVQK